MNLNINKWTEEIYQEYLNYLISLGETKYGEFSSKLTPTKYELIGIRIPNLRQIAKNITKGDYQSFLEHSQDKYFEEVLIEGLVIASIKDEEVFIDYFNQYIKKIDNWAINDVFCNSIVLFKDEKYFDLCLKLALSDSEFISRVGLISILSHYVNDNNINSIFYILDHLNSDAYYTKMAAAWLLCDCYIKHPIKTNEYLKISKLNNWTYNKAIQKMKESYRVSKEDKEYLNKLKR